MDPSTRLKLKRTLYSGAKVILGLVILLAAGKQILEALGKLEEPKVLFSARYLSLGVICYVAGMAWFAVFWRRALGGFGGKLTWLDCQAAYFVSQLGKYVPGKAWVILIRYGLIGEKRMSFRAVAGSSIYETFTVMGFGALLSFLVLLALGLDPTVLWLALGLAAALLAASHPPLSTWIAAVAGSWLGSGANALSVPHWRVFWKGMPLLLLGWLLVSVSFPIAGAGIGLSFSDPCEVLLAAGASGLAIAAGFVILVAPAGLGVREWILVQTLGPSLGEGPAALVAVSSRGLQVAGELCLGIILYGLRKGRGQRA